MFNLEIDEGSFRWVWDFLENKMLALLRESETKPEKRGIGLVAVRLRKLRGFFFFDAAICYLGERGRWVGFTLPPQTQYVLPKIKKQ